MGDRNINRKDGDKKRPASSFMGFDGGAAAAGGGGDDGDEVPIPRKDKKSRNTNLARPLAHFIQQTQMSTNQEKPRPPPDHYNSGRERDSISRGRDLNSREGQYNPVGNAGSSYNGKESSRNYASHPAAASGGGERGSHRIDKHRHHPLADRRSRSGSRSSSGRDQGVEHRGNYDSFHQGRGRHIGHGHYGPALRDENPHRGRPQAVAPEQHRYTFNGHSTFAPAEHQHAQYAQLQKPVDLNDTTHLGHPLNPIWKNRGITPRTHKEILASPPNPPPMVQEMNGLKIINYLQVLLDENRKRGKELSLNLNTQIQESSSTMAIEESNNNTTTTLMEADASVL